MESPNSSLLERVYHGGMIAALVRNPRKPHICAECRSLIDAGTPYYAVVYGGAGLGNIKFPKRVHPGTCLYTCMGFG